MQRYDPYVYYRPSSDIEKVEFFCGQDSPEFVAIPDVFRIRHEHPRSTPAQFACLRNSMTGSFE